ncbi:DUF922 domain-containing protein [Rhizobium sp. TRM95111]|nr:DUF922 domain-containing protein [Rhizobium alarense]MCF3642955.1 DUF922 domain-containing protein [Rhizobium alarense]
MRAFAAVRLAACQTGAEQPERASVVFRSYLLALLAGLVPPTVAAAADWTPVEQVKTYAIGGSTGLELYNSIGERGPEVGGLVRAIAHTDFKLTWTRDYQRRGNGCVLASARPKLVITYTLPKLAGRLPAEVERSWQTFIEGVRAHEQVHGEMIKDLTRQIETVTVGLSMDDDPQCRKIRKELTNRLAPLAASHRKRNRAFDQTEMSRGGNVHSLILALVNGG